jgi:heme/copper-type cytochrome/quinol oxidase subunit 2
VSRWKSPQTAARHAQRAAKEAEQIRRERRNSRLLIIAFVTVSVGLTVADYFWLKARAARRREEHQRIYHRQIQTNSPATHIPSAGKTNSVETP